MNYKELKNEVIKQNRCNLCGACEVVCPVEVIDLNHSPKLVGECIECGKCYEACSATVKDFEKSDIKKCFSAQAKGGEIKSIALDGGAVSAIIKKLLEKQKIDAAIVTKKDGLRPIPSLIETKEEVKETAGTKYGLVSLLKELKNTKENSKVAIVGTPCHIKAARYLQKNEYNQISYLISLFCMQNFDYNCLMNELKERGLEEEDITRIGIESGELMVTTEKYKEKIDLEEINNCSAEACSFCEDFEGYYSDLSIGSIDSKKGFSTVLIRTEKGKEAFEATKNDLEINEINNIDLVKKLSKIKENG